MIAYENLQKVNAGFEKAFKVKLKEFLTIGWYILGTQVSAFEKEFASFCGAKYCGYSHYFNGQQFPVSEEIHANTLSLPISYSTSEEEVHTVIEAVNKFYS